MGPGDTAVRTTSTISSIVMAARHQQRFGRSSNEASGSLPIASRLSSLKRSTGIY